MTVRISGSLYVTSNTFFSEVSDLSCLLTNMVEVDEVSDLKSAFSTSGKVLDAFRSSLTPKIVEALVCAQDWLRLANQPISIEENIDDVERIEKELCNTSSSGVVSSMPTILVCTPPRAAVVQPRNRQAVGSTVANNNVNVEVQVVPEIRLNIKSFEEGSIKGEERENECAICIAGFEKGDISTILSSCNHKFHSDCIAIWLVLHQTCPICRATAVQPVS
ncbi:E3 ubiquitin-protein ligase AIRP1-like [Ipomoea triloba]|uniref:E3 ubiquitin-protein ligase AIRP1-like n=1 Tax=Ipomoea triloba TaxID=35885 RepID=UPI00125D70F2|nr:E3 ubiquitin-protein ligase AIRP1-like [Ipomoea triloba]